MPCNEPQHILFHGMHVPWDIPLVKYPSDTLIINTMGSSRGLPWYVQRNMS